MNPEIKETIAETCANPEEKEMITETSAGSEDMSSETFIDPEEFFPKENKPEKRTFRWVLSLIGEILLIIPVLVVLLLLGKLFH